MDFSWLLLGITVIIGQIGLLLLVKAWINRQLQTVFYAPGKDQPSMAAQFVDLIGQRIATHLNAVKMGQLSAVARQEKKIQAAIQSDMLNASLPAGLGQVLSKMPQLQSIIKDQPELVQMAMPYIQQMLKGGGQQQEDNNNHQDELPSKLTL